MIDRQAQMLSSANNMTGQDGGGDSHIGGVSSSFDKMAKALSRAVKKMGAKGADQEMAMGMRTLKRFTQRINDFGKSSENSLKGVRDSVIGMFQQDDAMSNFSWRAGLTFGRVDEHIDVINENMDDAFGRNRILETRRWERETERAMNDVQDAAEDMVEPFNTMYDNMTSSGFKDAISSLATIGGIGAIGDIWGGMSEGQENSIELGDRMRKQLKLTAGEWKQMFNSGLGDVKEMNKEVGKSVYHASDYFGAMNDLTQIGVRGRENLELLTPQFMKMQKAMVDFTAEDYVVFWRIQDDWGEAGVRVGDQIGDALTTMEGKYSVSAKDIAGTLGKYYTKMYNWADGNMDEYHRLANQFVAIQTLASDNFIDSDGLLENLSELRNMSPANAAYSEWATTFERVGMNIGDVQTRLRDGDFAGIATDLMTNVGKALADSSLDDDQKAWLKENLNMDSAMLGELEKGYMDFSDQMGVIQKDIENSAGAMDKVIANERVSWIERTKNWLSTSKIYQTLQGWLVDLDMTPQAFVATLLTVQALAKMAGPLKKAFGWMFKKTGIKGLLSKIPGVGKLVGGGAAASALAGGKGAAGNAPILLKLDVIIGLLRAGMATGGGRGGAVAGGAAAGAAGGRGRRRLPGGKMARLLAPAALLLGGGASMMGGPRGGGDPNQPRQSRQLRLGGQPQLPPPSSVSGPGGSRSGLARGAGAGGPMQEGNFRESRTRPPGKFGKVAGSLTKKIPILGPLIAAATLIPTAKADAKEGKASKELVSGVGGIAGSIGGGMAAGAGLGAIGGMVGGPVGSAIGGVVGGVGGAVAGAIFGEEFTGWAYDNIDKLGAWGSDLKEGLGSTIFDGGWWGDKWKGAVEYTSEKAGAAKESWNGFKDSMGETLFNGEWWSGKWQGAVGYASDKMGDIKEGWSSFKDTLGDTIYNGEWWAEKAGFALGYTGEKFAMLGESWTGFKDKLGETIFNGEWWSGKWKGATEWAAEKFPGAVEAWGSFKDTIGSTIFNGEWWSGKWKGATEWSAEKWSSLSEAWSGFKDAVGSTVFNGEWWAGKWKGATEWSAEKWSNLSAAWSGFKEAVGSTVFNSEWWSGKWKGATQYAGEKWNNLATSWGSFKDKVGSTVFNSEWWSGKWKGVADYGSSKWAAATGTWNSMKTAVGNTIFNSDWWSGQWSTVASLGTSALNGVKTWWGGIKESFTSGMDKGRNAARGGGADRKGSGAKLARGGGLGRKGSGATLARGGGTGKGSFKMAGAYGAPQKDAMGGGWRMTSKYGIRSDPFTGKASMHRGVDYAASTGTAVGSRGEGKVIYSGWGRDGTGFGGGYGNVVAVKDMSGLIHLYAHLNKSLAKEGQNVAAGQKIGEVGSTGRSTGPHLHYEVRKGGYGTDVNPMPYVNDKLFSPSGVAGPSSETGGIDALGAARDILSANEGSYTSVARSDNGHGVSIGKLQWHEDRAKELMQLAKRSDPVTFNSVMNATSGGKSVIKKMGWNSWDEVKFSQGEADATKALFSEKGMQQVQEDLINRDITGYLNKAKAHGFKDGKAQVYFADLYNQSPRQATSIAKNALKGGGSLDAIHKAAMGNTIMSKYKTRRNNTYNKLKAMSGVSGSGSIEGVEDQYKSSNNAAYYEKLQKGVNFLGLNEISGTGSQNSVFANGKNVSKVKDGKGGGTGGGTGPSSISRSASLSLTKASLGSVEGSNTASEVHNKIVTEKSAPQAQSSNADVVDVIKWLSHRLEGKLEEVSKQSEETADWMNKFKKSQGGSPFGNFS